MDPTPHPCPPSLDSLPCETMEHLFRHLDPFDLLSLSLVCRSLSSSSQSNALWQPFCHPDWAVSASDECAPPSAEPVDTLRSRRRARDEEWKRAYVDWLRAALKLYMRNKAEQQGRSIRETVKPTDVFARKGIDCELKFVVAGPEASGKSSFLGRFCRDSFSPEHRPTKGVGFCPVELMYDGKTIKIDFWEIGGTNRLECIVRDTLRNAHALLLVYAMDKADTFIEDMRPFMIFDESHECAMVAIVGTKSDLVGVETDQFGPRICAGLLKAHYFQCSAKTGQGIEDVIEAALEHWIVTWCDVPRMKRPAFLPDVSVMEAAAAKCQQQNCVDARVAAPSEGNADEEPRACD